MHTEIIQCCPNRCLATCLSTVLLQVWKWNLCEKTLKRKRMLQRLKCTLQTGDEHITWANERVSDWRCVSPNVWKKKLYSEQNKRYNLSRGRHCGQAGSKTAVRTARIYYCMHSGLYTRTVHSVQRCWSMGDCCCAGLATNQGFRQPPQMNYTNQW
jgi:hypothetical protein